MDAKIDASKVKHYKRYQSKIPHLSEMMGMRLGVVGASQSGKGIACQQMILKLFRGCYSRVHIMAPTAKKDKQTWGPVEQYAQNVLKQDISKEPVLYDQWDPAVIEKTVADHAKVVAHQRERGDTKIYSILWVIDDYGDDPAIMHRQGGSILNKLAISGRHDFTDLWCIVQKLSLTAPTIRTQLTCGVFFAATAKETQFICDEFCPNGMDKETFKHIYAECTKEKYSFMMMDFRRPIEDRFWLRFERPVSWS